MMYTHAMLGEICGSFHGYMPISITCCSYLDINTNPSSEYPSRIQIVPLRSHPIFTSSARRARGCVASQSPPYPARRAVRPLGRKALWALGPGPCGLGPISSTHGPQGLRIGPYLRPILRPVHGPATGPLGPLA